MKMYHGNLDVVTMKVIACVILAVIVFLPIIITALLKRKRNPLLKYKYGMAMYLSSAHLWVGLLGAVVGYFFTILGIYVCNQAVDFWFILLFLFLAFMGTYLSICCMLEVILLESDSFTIVRPLFPAKRIRFCELTRIRYYENRILGYGCGRKVLDGYMNTKKVFSIDESFRGFGYLYSLFKKTGKLERPQIKEEFVVFEIRENIINDVLGVVFFGGMAVVTALFKDEVEPIFCIFFICLTLLCISGLIENLLWKVTVTYGTIYIRSKRGWVSAYGFREITSVIEETNHIILYSGEKKILRVFKDFKNFELLRNRLEAEHIPFYRKR